MTSEIKHAFERELITLPLTGIRLTKQMSVSVKQGRKYAQVLSSLREVGLIEPPVIALCRKQKEYLLLDGHLRLMALQELGEERVLCLVSVDDEGYTYNKFINRLSAVQEHKMIVKALKAGVSEEKLAATLNLDIITIRYKSKMLDGVCLEAVNLLKDKIMSETVFRVLKKMKPLRQIRVATLMNDQNRYGYLFAKSLLDGTPADQLTEGIKCTRLSRAVLEKRLRLEEESMLLREDIKALSASYGANMLHVTTVQAYLKTMMHNEKVLQYLQAYHPEIVAKFSEIIAISFLSLNPEGATSASSGAL